jgi:hypothetical protein
VTAGDLEAHTREARCRGGRGEPSARRPPTPPRDPFPVTSARLPLTSSMLARLLFKRPTVNTAPVVVTTRDAVG